MWLLVLSVISAFVHLCSPLYEICNAAIFLFFYSNHLVKEVQIKESQNLPWLSLVMVGPRPTGTGCVTLTEYLDWHSKEITKFEAKQDPRPFQSRRPGKDAEYNTDLGSSSISTIFQQGVFFLFL